MTDRRPGRVIGLDLGSRRIGVAVSDSDRTVATPIEVVERGPDPAADRRKIAAIVSEWEATAVVVGLPLGLRGDTGRAAQAAQAEIAALAPVVGVEVIAHDERLTTVTAERALADQGVRGPARRRVIDKVAAAVLLQSWLDGQRAGEP